jgi:ubiquinone biosynthesis protein COQ9
MAALIDVSTAKGRLLLAAMRLAETRDWSDITLLDIADAAGMPLSEMKAIAPSKVSLVTAFMVAVDDAVVSAAPKRDLTQPARDRLFEVIMGRFDVMMPYKAALKSIAKASALDPALIQPFYAAQHWMLQAAGIGTDGTQGSVRVLGLGSLYGAVFRTWLDDEDPGMARTMASLDRRLRRGEQTINTIEDTVSGVMKFTANLPGLVSTIFNRGRKTSANTPPSSTDAYP